MLKDPPQAAQPGTAAGVPSAAGTNRHAAFDQIEEKVLQQRGAQRSGAELAGAISKSQFPSLEASDVDDELAALKKSPEAAPRLAPALRRHPHPGFEPIQGPEWNAELEELKRRSTSSEPGSATLYRAPPQRFHYNRGTDPTRGCRRLHDFTSARRAGGQRTVFVDFCGSCVGPCRCDAPLGTDSGALCGSALVGKIEVDAKPSSATLQGQHPAPDSLPGTGKERPAQGALAKPQLQAFLAPICDDPHDRPSMAA